MWNLCEKDTSLFSYMPPWRVYADRSANTKFGVYFPSAAVLTTYTWKEKFTISIDFIDGDILWTYSVDHRLINSFYSLNKWNFILNQIEILLSVFVLGSHLHSIKNDSTIEIITAMISSVHTDLKNSMQKFHRTTSKILTLYCYRKYAFFCRNSICRTSR